MRRNNIREKTVEQRETKERWKEGRNKEKKILRREK